MPFFNKIIYELDDVVLESEGLILQLNSDLSRDTFLETNSELLSEFTLAGQVDNKIYLRGSFKENTIFELDEIQKNNYTGLEDYNLSFNIKSNNPCDHLSENSILKGQKSLVIRFKKENSITDFYNLNVVHRPIEIELIATNTYLLKYPNENINKEAFQQLNNTSIVHSIEPNFRHENKVNSHKKRRNEIHLFENLSTPTSRELIDEELRVSELNSIQYGNINFDLKTDYGDETIKIGIADNYIDLKHPAFSNLENDPDQCVFINEMRMHTDKSILAHGTAVAGLAVGYDADAENKLFRGIGAGCMFHSAIVKSMYEDEGYHISLASIIRGLNWLITVKEVDIVNGSWYYPYTSKIVADLINDFSKSKKNNKKVIFVFAAGNKTTNVRFPACLESVIAVGGSNIHQHYHSKSDAYREPDGWYSAEGSAVNLAAPSTYLISADLLGVDFGLNIRLKNFQSKDYSFCRGTSAAAPLVSGAIGLLLSLFPSIDRDIILNTLLNSCFKPREWDEKKWGKGILNLKEAIEKLRTLN